MNKERCGAGHAGDDPIDAGLTKFEQFIVESGIDVTIIDTASHTLSVSQAAEALGFSDESILKTLLFHDTDGNLVIAIASGTGRIDTNKLAGARNMGTLKLAKPAMVLEILGYPAGGVPPVGHASSIPVVVDTVASRLDVCYAGAGTIRHLAQFRMSDVLRLTNAGISSIVGEDAYSPALSL